MSILTQAAIAYGLVTLASFVLVALRYRAKKARG